METQIKTGNVSPTPSRMAEMRSLALQRRLYDQEYEHRKARDGFKNSHKMSNEEWGGEPDVVQVRSASIPATKQRQQAQALCGGGVKLKHMGPQKLRVDTKTRSVGPELKTPGARLSTFF